MTDLFANRARKALGASLLYGETNPRPQGVQAPVLPNSAGTPQ